VSALKFSKFELAFKRFFILTIPVVFLFPWWPDPRGLEPDHCAGRRPADCYSVRLVCRLRQFSNNSWVGRIRVRVSSVELHRFGVYRL